MMGNVSPPGRGGACQYFSASARVGPVVIAVTPSLPVASVKDLVALAKAKPGQLNYATAGVGSFQHLAAELFRLQTGTDMVHVPFKGGGPAMMDVIAGNTQIAVGSLAQMIPQIKAGKLKALAVATAKRSPILPDLPTLAEAGLQDVYADAWMGFVVPARTPQPIVQRIERELTAVLREPDVREKLRAQTMEVVAGTPEEFRATLAGDLARWKPVIEKNHITLD